MIPQNALTPTAEVRALLPAPVVTAIEKVDQLRERTLDAVARENKYGPLAAEPDKHYLTAVRTAVAGGGSAQDVPDERGEWVRQYDLARADHTALNPLLEVAWRDMRTALTEHLAEALGPIESVIAEAAVRYRDALDAAGSAGLAHRRAIAVRRWITSGQRKGGPDPYKGDREPELAVQVKDGFSTVTMKPSEALALLRADADLLSSIHADEAAAEARAERERQIQARVAAAAEARDQEDAMRAEARRRRQAAEQAERERKANARRPHVAQVPG